MRAWLLLALCACSKEAAAPRLGAPGSAAATGAASDAAVPALPSHRAFRDLGTALVAIIPAGARVVGFGELHARTDRAQVTSSLARFTQARSIA